MRGGMVSPPNLSSMGTGLAPGLSMGAPSLHPHLGLGSGPRLRGWQDTPRRPGSRFWGQRRDMAAKLPREGAMQRREAMITRNPVTIHASASMCEARRFVAAE